MSALDGRDILRQHGAMVWRTLCRLVGGRHGQGEGGDLEDSFQEVFVAALEVGRREEVNNWEALLRRIATTRGLDLLRARIRARSRVAGEVEWEALPSAEPPAGAPAEQAELAAELRQALVRLKPREAELFCLRHIEEMSYQEIAEALDMSADAVGVSLHRIRGKLREWLSTRKVWSTGEVRDE